MLSEQFLISRRALGLVLCALWATSSCGGSAKAPTAAPVPTRTSTAGDHLLSVAPSGADVVLEIDLARLRANVVVGGVLTALAAPDEAANRGDLLARAESLLVCVYGVGDVAKQLIVVQASDGEEFPGAAAIGGGRFAVGDPDLVARAVAVGSGQGESVLADAETLRLRASVMPEKAEFASLRGVVMLDFDARVEVASRTGMSAVPVSIALWGDVVDDLAVVAQVTGDSDASPERLSAALAGLRERVAKQPLVRFLGLAPALAAARLTRSGGTVRVVLVLTPKRLELLAKRLVLQLQSISPSTPNSSESKPAAINP